MLTDLRRRFDEVLTELESVAGWKTARVQRPVQILGSLDGIETGVRQLIRDEPLETAVVDYHGARITVPTEGEILRIKGVLILKRNATRDYLDFVALADHMGDENVACALQSFDRLYQQDNGELPLQQLQVQLANALPYDLEETELSEYKNLNSRWHDWQVVKAACSHLSTRIFDRVMRYGCRSFWQPWNGHQTNEESPYGLLIWFHRRAQPSNRAAVRCLRPLTFLPASYPHCPFETALWKIPRLFCGHDRIWRLFE